jgi:putative transposase
MVEQMGISERRACRLVGLSRTSYRQPPTADAATASLGQRIAELADQRRRFGYRRIHDLLRGEGLQVNHKRVWRLYSERGLAVRKRRKTRRASTERQPFAGSQPHQRGLEHRLRHGRVG